MQKISIAALIGGVVLFVWSAISHMVLPLGEAGIDAIEDEEPVLEAMRAAVPVDGLYMFPAIKVDSPDEAEMKAWEAKAAVGPAGLLVYCRHGKPMGRDMLIMELVTNTVAMLLAVPVVGTRGGTYRSRVVR